MSIGAWSSAREAQAFRIATGLALGLMLAGDGGPVVAPLAVRIGAGPARSSLYVKSVFRVSIVTCPLIA
jgi:hypothetical protein